MVIKRRNVSRLSLKNSRWSISSSAPASAMVASGRFTRNTERHPNALTRNPPMTGPAIPPAPMTLMCVPMPLPRSSSGKTDVIIAMEPVPWVIAAPVPWTMREATSMSIEDDEAANTDAPIRSKSPAMYTCLRPSMSDRPSHWQQEGAYGERLGYHDPLDGGQVCLEVSRDRREGDVYCPKRHDSRERAESHSGKDKPLVVWTAGQGV